MKGLVLITALILCFLAGIPSSCQVISQNESTALNDPQGLNLSGLSENTTELIPREVLFGNPERAGVQLSPDGRNISYLAPVNGVLNVWVGPVDNITSARPVTNDTFRGIRGYFWAYTNHHIIYVQDRNGDENWRAYSVDLDSGDVKDLTPERGVNAQIQEVSYKFPDEILVGLNDRDPELHDIYRINIISGEREMVMENPGFAGFMTDDEYKIRFGIKQTPDGGQEMLVPAENGSWAQFMAIGPDDAMTTGPAGFDRSGNVLYLIDSRGRNTAALATLDLITGRESILAEDPRADISEAMSHPVKKEIEAVAFTYDRKQWKILTSSVAPDLDYLATVADGEIAVADRTLDDRHWIVAYLQDNGPVRYYLYERDARKARFLFSHRSSLEGLPLARMHPVVIKSRDGLDLVSYYTLPVWSTSNSNNSTDSNSSDIGLIRPDKPLPMVLLVHGGPWARDDWGYNSEHQMLANRGYAVLSINYRGSTGLGKNFTNAGNLEWGRKMEYDLLDAANWSIEQGIADPSRIAIMGGSYGGYAVLSGLTLAPEFFACGVDEVGPSNLTSFINSIPPYWKPQLDILASRVGDHRTPEGRALLEERSPLNYVERIRRPLLIAQGANDPRVNRSESDTIVRAVEAKKIPVTYLLYPDEGHGFARPENRISYYALVDIFLAEHLGGRYQPIGTDFNGSSITVLAGAGEIPGLDQALTKK